jgi:hypothetical protein
MGSADNSGKLPRSAYRLYDYNKVVFNSQGVRG